MFREAGRQQQPATKQNVAKPFLISWSLASPTLQTILDETAKCEQRHLDGVWFPDYEAPLAKWPELYVTLSAIASHTRTLRFGSLITDVVRRHPLVTAHAFASLSQIAPGRVILGMGAGAGTTQYPFGISLKHSVSKLAEGIRVIRTLWGSKDERVDFSGRYFSLKAAQAPMFPLSRVPIYLASYGPKMLDLTAELADGWLPESHTPETYRKTLGDIHEKMRLFDRDPNDLHSCCASIFYPWEPDEKGFSRLIGAAKRYLADYPDIQWMAGSGKEHPGLRTHQIEQNPELLQKLANQVPDALAESTLVYGSISQCYEKLCRMSDAGCAEAILEPYWIGDQSDPKSQPNWVGRVLDGVEMAGRIKSMFVEGR
jgi:alkanesulfonate monooxygenase SsuD/methylene tetrahydromethanopterin reductase-like flavin-dependent oxidoreductase (luciferase family)